ncbi:MAG: hypothetical protein J5685_04775 [Clostridiales bacterium]|nr:hypothetical protein [Clostridiales bacterium]
MKKRKILAALLASSLALSLMSCDSLKKDSGDDEEDETEETEVTEETATSESEETSGSSSEETETEPSEVSETSETEPVLDVTIDPGNRVLDGLMPVTSGDYLNIYEDYGYRERDGSYYYYETIGFGRDTAALYPELVDGIELYNTSLAEYGMTNVRRTLTVRRSDSSFLSFMDVLSGNDGVMNMWGINYNVTTGQQVSLRDIVSDTAALGAAAGITDEDNGQMMTWIIEPYGITYIIDPMGDEPRYYTALYRGNEDLFTDQFTLLDSYWLDLSDRGIGSYTIDIGNNGTPDTIDIDCEYDGYGIITSYDVIVNGNSCHFNGDGYFEGFDIEYSVLSLDGRTFLYVSVGTYSDSSDTYVFELTESGASYIDMLYGSFSGIPIEADNMHISEYQPEDTVVLRSVPSDPSILYIRERTYFLGTNGVLYETVRDDRGFPVIRGTYGYVTGSPVITALVDVPAYIFTTGNGEPDSVETTIPRGSSLRIVFYTLGDDGMGMAVLRDCATGELYRIVEYASEKPYTIDGLDIPENEVFGGIMYSA